MTLKADILSAIEHPYTTAFTPTLFLGKRKHACQLVKLLLFIDPVAIQDLQQYLLETTGNDDPEILEHLREFIIRFTSADNFYKKFAQYYGLNYEHDKKLIKSQVNQQILRPLKITYNHLAEQYQSQKRIQFTPPGGSSQIFSPVDTPISPNSLRIKLHKRRMKRITDAISFILTMLVTVGQATIAATCFIVAGITGPLFWPIFIAALLANYLLLRTGIKGLLRKFGSRILFKSDFLQGLTGIKRKLAYVCMLFAFSSGATIAIMSITTSYSAIMAILPVLGLGFLAVPGLGWAIAIMIGVATLPVFTALMFESMVSFITDFKSNIALIKNYFDPRMHLQSYTPSEILGFILSRGLQVIFGLATVALVLFSAISTFGSFMSSISQTMQSVLKISAKVADAISFVVVFACNLIPGIIFNFKNILNFIYHIPQEIKTAFSRAKMIFHTDLHPVAKVFIFGSLVVTLFFLGCVALNGFGNGKTGSIPTGAGVQFLMKLFHFSPGVATTIGLITRTTTSVAANETYGMKILNDHTSIATPTTPEQPVSTDSEKSSQLPYSTNPQRFNRAASQPLVPADTLRTKHTLNSH